MPFKNTRTSFQKKIKGIIRSQQKKGSPNTDARTFNKPRRDLDHARKTK
ncbi:MAG: hypothetical protein ACLGHN_08830 [Bacteriovoracia bacterium]